MTTCSIGLKLSWPQILNVPVASQPARKASYLGRPVRKNEALRTTILESSYLPRYRWCPRMGICRFLVFLYPVLPPVNSDKQAAHLKLVNVVGLIFEEELLIYRWPRHMHVSMTRIKCGATAFST